MKKSELYTIAILSVMDDEGIKNTDRLEIIDLLLADRRHAVYAEELEAQKQAEKEAW